MASSVPDSVVIGLLTRVRTDNNAPRYAAARGSTLRLT